MSPPLFEKLTPYMEFKADFHNVSIRVQKDPKITWNLLSYLVSDTDVQEVVGYQPIEWREPTTLDVGTSKGTEISAA